MGDKYSDNTKFIMDQESLHLVNEAYNDAKKIVTENKEKFISFSELFINNTIVYDKDIMVPYITPLKI